MKNKKNFFIISLSAIFAVVLCIAIIFSIRPTYASTVTITSSDGTSVYITGEGVSWDEDNNKYVVENGKPIQVHIINEYRIFSSAVVNGNTYNTSLISIPGNEITGDFSIEVSARAATTADEGRYFSKPFIIADDEQLIALDKILDGRYSNDDFKLFGFDPSDDDFSADTTIAALQKGYYVLSENILLDANEFYGIGSKPNNVYDEVHLPFQGCFDFMGYHITLNVLNQYTAYTSSSTDLDPTTLFSGLFGYVNGNGSDASIIRDADVNGKIAFVGNYGTSVYHYVGGIAGHIDSNTTLTDAKSEVSITTETNSPLFVGGLFGSLATSLEERFKFTYACHYGVLQATSSGAGTNISIGSLAGLIRDTHVYHFEDKSVATHIVANNLGSGSHNSGTAVVGGVAGTVYANTSNVYLKNIVCNNAEDRSITALIDSNDSDKYGIASGVYGIFDRNTDTSYYIYTDLASVNNTSGSLDIRATTPDADSRGTLYAAGFIGKLNQYGHGLIYDYNVEKTLLNGNVSILASQSGKGATYAGGLFGYGVLNIPNNSEDVSQMNSIILNSGINDSTLTITSLQTQSTSKDGLTLYDCHSGYFTSKIDQSYILNNFEITVNNATLTSQREIGSTSIGNLYAGGIAGEALSDGSENSYISNVNVNMNNSSINALSLSFDSVYGPSDVRIEGNNASAGGLVGHLHYYGKTVVTENKDYTFDWGDSTVGIKNINVVVNNYSDNSPEITIYCVQNATPGSSSDNYFSEGYAGGVVAFFDYSYAENINIKSINETAVVYYNGTNAPNTASCGGLIGETKDYLGSNNQQNRRNIGINGGSVDNLKVVGKGYSNLARYGDNDYDLYVGGAVGCVATWNRSYLSDIHVFNTSVYAVGEDAMFAYAGGVCGGLWWTTTAYLLDSSFVSGYVYASSITSEASAGGLTGYARGVYLKNNVVSNSYVDSKSNESKARSGGISGYIFQTNYIGNNYSQAYLSAQGSTTSNSLIAAIGVAIDGNYYNKNYITADNYFDVGSMGNSYLGNSDTIPTIIYSDNKDNNDTNNSNPIVLYLDSSNRRYSSLNLYNPRSGSQVSNADIYKNIGDNQRLLIKLEGDTDTISYANPINSNTNVTAISGKNGLVVASVWVNIYGKTITDATASTLLEEDGWYSFCSYAIKVNEGRPSEPKDELSIQLLDADTNKNIKFEYAKNSNGDYYQLDENGNAVTGTATSENPYAVTEDTNVAGYYKLDDYTTYALINMGQTGFYEKDLEHVASSIKISAKLTNDNKLGYVNFPKYAFYEPTSTANMFGDESLWTVPYVASGTNFENRINSLLDSKGGNVYSSKFNGKLSVDRLLNEYALVITPNSELTARTVIIIEYENKEYDEDTGKMYAQNYYVILEFVPNTINGINIEPAEDTPPLYTYSKTEQDGEGNDVEYPVYVYVTGDTVRFEAFEDKRYNQLSFLSNVKFNASGTYGLKANGQMNVPEWNSDDLIPVTCYMVSDDSMTGKVYVDVLPPIDYSINSIGAYYDSDRLAVQSTNFNFSFYSSPGYGLGPERVVITTYDSSSTELRTYDLVSGGLGFSTTTSFKDNVFTYLVDESESVDEPESHDFLVSFNHLTGLYEVVVPSTIMTSSVDSIEITIEFPVVYSIVFDTGLTGVEVSERYIVYQVKQGTLLDNFFYEQVYSEVFNAIKDTRYGFTLHDYYLTDDASTLPRYGETFVTMTTPLFDGETGLYYFLLDPDAEDEEVNREYVVESTTGIWYKDLDKDGNLDDDTEKDDSNKFSRWRTVTGPYTFYARWTYDIAIEIPDGVTISSPLANEKLIPIEDNDPDKINGKQNIVPINTNNGFPFTISTDSSFEVTPRFKVYQVTLGSGNWYIDADENGIYEKQYDSVIYTGNVNLINTVSDSNGNALYYYYIEDGNQVRLVPDDYIYTDLTKYVTSYGSNSNTYIIPQYDALGKSLINGVIFLKVFNEVVDYEVSDIGEFGSVSTNNSIYEDGIFTVTYNVNYSSVVIDGTVYKNGIPVAHTAAGHNTSFRFDGSVTLWYEDTNSNNTYDSATDTLVDELHSEDVKEKIVDSVFQYYYYINDADEEVRVVPQTYDLTLPSGTSFRLYRKINGVAYDAGVFVSNSELTQVSLSNFTNIETNGAMSINSSMLIKSEQYNLVVTLPKQHSGFVTDFVNSKVVIVTDFTENYKRFAYTLTFGYDGEGNLMPIQPRSYFVLQSTTRHESFREKAFDIFNIYSYNPASGSATRLSAPTEEGSGFTLQFTPSSGKQPNIFDHRHGSSYYVWEVEKTYSTDETGASVIRQYTAKDASGNDVSVVSETQHHYYYLAINGNLNLLNVPSGCKIRLLEVDSLANPAAGVVIDTYPAN